MQICFGTSINKFTNHSSPDGSKYMETPTIKYSFHYADSFALCIMYVGLIHPNTLSDSAH